MRVELVGFEQVLQAVRNLPDTVKTKAMKGIMVKNMQPVAKGIKAITPNRKDGGKYGNRNKQQNAANVRKSRNVKSSAYNTLPGNLKKSIGVKAFGKGTKVDTYAGINKRSKVDGWYGFFVARGTQHISKNDFISRGAAPQLQTAANNLSDDITRYIVSNAQRLGLNAR